MTTYTNEQNVPEVLAKALQRDDYDKGKAEYTPTSLIKPPYMSMLLKKYEDEIVVDVSENFWILLGKTMHSILEKDTDGSMAERRVYMNIGGKCVGMKFDNLQLTEGVLDDYKLTSVYKFIKNYDGTWPDAFDWEAQLNIGAFILRSGGEIENEGNITPFQPIEIKQLRIIGLLKDYSKAKGAGNKFYPEHSICVRPIRTWSDQEALTYIQDRINVHEKAKSWPIEKVPPCTPDETWQKGEVWAVMKNKNAKSTKNCTSVAQAEAKISELKKKDKTPQSYRVEHRKPTRGRCSSYCSLGTNNLCPDYKSQCYQGLCY